MSVSPLKMLRVFREQERTPAEIFHWLGCRDNIGCGCSLLLLMYTIHRAE